MQLMNKIYNKIKECFFFMIRTLKDIIELKNKGDLNKLIVEDEAVISYFKEDGLVGCEYIPDRGLGQDQDFDYLLNYLGAKIKFDVKKDYVLIHDKNTYIFVRSTDYENRFNSNCGDETFYNFNDIHIVNKEIITK